MRVPLIAVGFNLLWKCPWVAITVTGMHLVSSISEEWSTGRSIILSTVSVLHSLCDVTKLGEGCYAAVLMAQKVHGFRPNTYSSDLFSTSTGRAQSGK